MTFYSNNLILVEDSLENIHLFELHDGVITKYYFKNNVGKICERILTKEVLKEYDISIDEENKTYIIYQNKDYYLVLQMIDDNNINEIILTEGPIPEIYNLNIEIVDKKPHIFYCILFSEMKKEYRIYHHYLDGVDWITNIVDEINIKQLLNPMRLLKKNEELIILYCDSKKTEEVYKKSFDLNIGKWKEKIQLTASTIPKLYLDSILVDNKLHLVYCEYDENLAVKYERYDYSFESISREIEKTLSNKENIAWPTLIYYEDRLWVIWLEYENIMSRFSLDNGKSWSSIYLWNESKITDIVRYKYYTRNRMEYSILNHSFGKIQPYIEFIGFGDLINTTEIPLKKKMKLALKKI